MGFVKSCFFFTSEPVEFQGTGLTQFTVQSSFEALKDIHKELLIYSTNLRILDTIGQGNFCLNECCVNVLEIISTGLHVLLTIPLNTHSP